MCTTAARDNKLRRLPLIERAFRRYCARKGGWIYATATLDHASLRRACIRGTVRLALDIGRAVESATATGGDPVAGLLRVAGGKRLLRGKIVDVERRFRRGHDWGTVRIEGLDGDQGRRARSPSRTSTSCSGRTGGRSSLSPT